jgi:hypothetical protein
MKKTITSLLSLLLLLPSSSALAQIAAGWYRVQNASSLRSVSVKGTSYSTSTDPDAFYNCIKMQDKANAYTDPGTIVYISQTKDGDGISIFGQGTDTKTITTDKYITIKHQKYTGSTNGNVIANSLYYQLTVTQGVDFYLQDYGGLDLGRSGIQDYYPGIWGFGKGSPNNIYACWSILPISDENYFGVKPYSADVKDSEGNYWTTLCCDFDCIIPSGGGVLGAYTIKKETTSNGINYAKPELLYSPGETIPGGTPVLLKLKYNDASLCKLTPSGTPKNIKTFPLTSNALEGNYFGPYKNYNSTSSTADAAEYDPDKGTTNDKTNYRVLYADATHPIGFYKYSGTYMSSNKAWLDLSKLSTAAKGIGTVYLDFDDATTGIDEVNTEQIQPKEDVICDLMGRRVTNPQHGIYIKNGKKVIYK